MATLLGNLRGPQGQTGETGPAGANGQDGAPGQPGQDGATGPPGPPGGGITLRAWPDSLTPSVPNLELLDPAPGDMYLIDGDGWAWDGDAWSNVGSIQGPPGLPGEPGQPGTNGTNGTNGQDGAAGPRGTGWFAGAGPPQEPVAGAGAGDLYLNTINGDVYELAGA